MSVEEQRAEVQRILSTPQFRRAPKLRCFLELVCDYHFQGRAAAINEHLIATQAFGKGAAFDPGEDSLVRVQARELRRRLHEHYEADGRNRPWILEIPSGQYAPVFRRAQPAIEAAPGSRKPAPLRAAWIILAGTVLICAALLFAADHERRLLLRSSAVAASLSRPLPTPSIDGL